MPRHGSNNTAQLHPNVIFHTFNTSQTSICLGRLVFRYPSASNTLVRIELGHFIMSALEGGNPDEEDAAQKATRLAARAARFNKSAPGQRNKVVCARVTATDHSGCIRY